MYTQWLWTENAYIKKVSYATGWCCIYCYTKKKKKKEKGSLFKMKEIAVIITGKSGVLDNLPVSDVLRIS